MDTWFSTEIIKWYRLNKRNLPWREEKDAYRIWLSEIILQQTQVAQGTAYYFRFINAYPTIKHLARAHEDEVLKLWQGLGYYSRARNLLFTAKLVMEEHGGVFPSDYLKIKSLKGIGDYTAAAIASFAYDLPQAVVDGNVYRLLSRVFGIDLEINTLAAKKHFFELANKLLNPKKAAIHNQAIMEFGSQYCKPQKPDCQNCVLKHKCYAFNAGRVSDFPVKTKKQSVKKRYFNYLVIANSKEEILLRRREGNDIWKGLYEFMLIETKTAVSEIRLFAGTEFKALCPGHFTVRFTSQLYKHVLSHQLLMARFYVLTQARHPKAAGTITVSIKKLNGFAFPRLIEKFLEDCDLKEIF